MLKDTGRIVPEGMGGFLNPPGHPEHTHSVRTMRGDFYSLSSAVGCEYLTDGTRAAAARKLADWVKLPLSSAAVSDWVCNVLGYFRGCYVGPDGNRNADALEILQRDAAETLANAASHAGVLLILDYYPDYQPTAADFAGAYWGTRPE